MPYDKDIANDVIRALKQPPGDLRVLLYKYGEFRPIEEIKTRYVIPITYSSGPVYYVEVEEGTEDAIQVITIA